jgi:hypothetical protein
MGYLGCRQVLCHAGALPTLVRHVGMLLTPLVPCSGGGEVFWPCGAAALFLCTMQGCRGIVVGHAAAALFLCAN